MGFDETSHNNLLSQLTTYYNEQLNKKKTFNKDSELILSLNNFSHKNLIEVLQHTQLPVLKEVYLNDLNEFNNAEVVNQFLSQVSPGTKEFT